MSTARRWTMFVLMTLIATTFFACKSGPTEAQEPMHEAPASDNEAVTHGEAKEASASKDESLPEVTVNAEGIEFDPPVQKAQLPHGAWICDMGTVHYARMNDNGKPCPLCGMRLVEHGADDEASGHDHHGHGH